MKYGIAAAIALAAIAGVGTFFYMKDSDVAPVDPTDDEVPPADETPINETNI